MNKFNFAFITDKNYLQITIVAIWNLLKTKNDNSYYKIYLIYTEKNIIDDIIKFDIENYEIELIYFDDNLISKFNGIGHVSKATYIKYFIPNLINEEKILFLDGDIYINRNIEDIWQEFSEKHSIMAIADPGYVNENELIGINDNEKTFNAGVLLLNLSKMREKKMCERMIEFTEKNQNKIKNADQTVFNAVCKSDWKELICSYNLQRIHFMLSHKELKIDKDVLKLYRKKPYIVHFTTHSKPWMFRCAHPYKLKYLKNYKELFEIKYKDISYTNFMKNIFERMQYLKARS